VIAATNRNLQDMIAQGQFREDLFYRLNVIHFWVPPLRERREDIPQMIEHFLAKFTRATATWCAASTRGLPGAHRVPWPGNVRELENVIERLVVTGRHEVVKLDDLPMEVRAQRGISLRPKRERRKTVADELYKKMTDEGASFWTAVYPSTWIATSPGRTCATSCARASRNRAATIRSCAGCSTWSRATTEVPQLPAQARLPAAVQGVPPVSRSRRFAARREPR